MEESVAFLLSLGCDPNQSDNNGNTALHIAAGIDSRSIVKRLVYGGSDTGMENKAGEKAIELAEMNSNSEIVNMLRRNCKLRDSLLLNSPIRPIVPKYYSVAFCFLFMVLTLISTLTTVV